MPTVRLGLLTLPLAGLLVTWAAIASSAFFDFSDAGIDPQEVATAYASLGYFLSQFVGYILGLTFLTIGVFALTVYLSDIQRRALDAGRDDPEHPGHRHAALPLRPAHLRRASPWRSVPGRGAERRGVGQCPLWGSNQERLLRGLLTLFGGLHPLRVRRVGVRDAAQVGWGTLGHPRPDPLRAPAGPILDRRGVAAADRRRVGRFRRSAEASGRGASPRGGRSGVAGERQADEKKV